MIIGIKSMKGLKFRVFVNWINRWADFDKHKECLDKKYTLPDGSPNHITTFGRGYDKAISDVFDFLISNRNYNQRKKDVK